MKYHLPVFGYHNEQEYIPAARAVCNVAYITDDMGEVVEATSDHIYAQEPFYSSLGGWNGSVKFYQVEA